MRSKYKQPAKALLLISKSRLILSLFLLIFASLGTYFLLFSHAATLTGDINGDGTVNAFDLSLLLSSYGTNTTCTTNTNYTCDLNSDGKVDNSDLGILQGEWGQSSGSGGSAPVNDIAPYFTASTVDSSGNCSNGCAIEGQQLSVTPGTWTNAPTSYSYQWMDCTTTSAQPPKTGNCINAKGTGANTNTYTVAASDVGYSLVPIMTARNGSGSAATTIAGSRCSSGEIPWTDPTLAYNDSGRSAGPIVAGVGCSPISAQVGATQSVERFCSNSPTTCGYGDPLAGTVGVPPGTSLTPASQLSLTSSGCSGLSNPSWCSGSGTAGDPWVVKAVSVPHIDMSGGYWQVQDSQITYNGSGCGVICASGGTLYLFDSTLSAPDNTTNSFTYGVYSEGGDNVTLNAVYIYNGERILVGAGTFENSYCYENAGQSGSHHECWEGGSGQNVVSNHNVFVQPWSETGNFDGGGNSISSNNDLFVGGGGYNIYPGPPCGTDNVTDGRFSRFYWPNSGQWGVNYDPGCSTMTWTGNTWDDTGVTVLDTATGS